MKESDFPEKQVDPGRLRLLILVPIGWIVLGVIVPGFVTGLLDRHNVLVENLSQVTAIILFGGLLAYLLLQIRKERWLIRVVLASVAFLMLSVLLQISRRYHVFDNILAPNTQNVLRQIEIAFNGLGLAATMFAFFYAIADLLAARQQLLAGQARLSQEIARREQAESAIRKSESQYRHLVEDSTDIIFEADSGGVFTYVNAAGLRVMGYESEEIIGKHYLEFVFPEDREELQRTLRRSVQRNDAVTYCEFRGVCKDGGILWLGQNTRPLFDEANHWGFRAMARDNTERKRVEEALRESERRFRTLADNLPSAVLYQIVGDAAGHRQFTYISDAVCRLNEVSVEAVLADASVLYSQMLPQHVPGLAAAEEKAAREGTVFRYEFQARLPSGRIRWFELSASTRMLPDGCGMSEGVQMDITERKQAEEALQSEHSLLVATLDSTTDGILVVDRSGKVTSFNRKFLDLWRIPESLAATQDDEQLQQFVLDQLERPDVFLDKVRNLYQTPELNSMDELAFKDGRVFERFSQPQRVGDTIVGRVWSFREITERNRVEEALRKSERKYRELVEHANSIIVHWTRDGQVTFLNEFGQRFFGYSEAEILGQHVVGTIVPETESTGRDLRFIIDQIGADPLGFEHNVNENMRRDGEKVWIAWTNKVDLDDQGRVAGILSIGTDITELKQAEEALRRSEELLSNAVEMARLGHWEYDVVRDLFTFNDHFYKVFHATAGQVGGYTMPAEEYARRFVHPDDRAVIAEETRKAVETSDPHFSRSLEHRILFADGTEGHVSVRFSILKDAHGKTVKTYGVNQDITERKNAEEKLRIYQDNLEELVKRRTEELEERSLRLSEEVADRKRAEEAFREVSRRLYQVRDEEGRRVARELHDSAAQELAAIVMNLGGLEDMLPRKNAEARRLFARTLALAEKCSQEVRTLSYLLHPPLLDQLGLVSALRAYVEGFSKRSGVSVVVEAPSECDRLPAEVELTLFRVMQESLGNIHRHSGSTTACIQLTRNPDSMVLEVSDEGCGIPPEVLASIRRHSSVGGVGIAGMQERLRLLNGTLSVESSSTGTTILAIIPLGSASI